MAGMGGNLGPGLGDFLLIMIILGLAFFGSLICAFLAAISYTYQESSKKSMTYFLIFMLIAVLSFTIPNLFINRGILPDISKNYGAILSYFVIPLFFLAVSYVLFRLKIQGKKRNLLWVFPAVLSAVIGLNYFITGLAILILSAIL